MSKESKELNKRSKINTTVSSELLESYRGSLYAIKKFFDNVTNNFSDLDIETQMKVTKAVLESGEKIGKNIESLDKLEDKVKREERESISRKGSSETSLFEE